MKFTWQRQRSQRCRAWLEGRSRCTFSLCPASLHPPPPVQDLAPRACDLFTGVASKCYSLEFPEWQSCSLGWVVCQSLERSSSAQRARLSRAGHIREGRSSSKGFSALAAATSVALPATGGSPTSLLEHPLARLCSSPLLVLACGELQRGMCVGLKPACASFGSLEKD